MPLANGQTVTGNNRKLMVVAVCCLGILAAAATGLHFTGSLRGEGAHKAGPALTVQSSNPPPGLGNRSSALPANFDQSGIDGGPALAQAAPAMQASLQKTDDSPPTLSQAPPSQAPVINQAPPSAAPALHETPAGMPDDIRKWLEFLAEIERQRQALATAELTQAITIFGNLQAQDITAGLDPNADDSQDEANKRTRQRANGYANSAEGMRSQWQQLSSKFLSVTPPSACAGIQRSYSTTLTATGTMILEITNAVRSAASDHEHALSILMSLQGTSSSRVDAPARETDQGVAAICAKYNTAKWFEIKADVGGGLMSQIGL